MQKVTVIAAAGARVAGPCRLKLTKAQHRRRAAVLGPWESKGGAQVFELDGGQALQFKHGESFEIDTPAKLNRLVFDWPEEDGDEGADGDAEALPLAEETPG